MNAAYIYLQVYRLFDNITPIKADCGELCSKACCSGDDGGMYLFPMEEQVYKLINPSWSRIEESDFTYEYNGKTKNVPIIFCNGACDRYQRPLACRIFPLTPYLNGDKLDVIVDPRAKSLCPLSKALEVDEYDYKFVKNIKKAFTLLMKIDEFRAYMRAYSEYIDEYRKFFSDGSIIDE